MINPIIEYALILTNAAAFGCLVAGVVLLNSRKSGGIHFFRVGRFGGSFYIAKGSN